jgi:hypothetical protein
MSLATSIIDPNASNGTMATHGSDKNLAVEFSYEPFHLEYKSREEGRQIYEDRPFITIYYPGDTTKVTKRFADDLDFQRFPAQWSAFKQQESQASTGFPLKEWTQITKSQAMELAAMHIHTVEQLAAVPDGQLRVLGSNDLIARAKAYVNATNEHALESKMAAENDTLKNEIAALKAQVEEITRLHSKSDKIKLKE